MTMPDEECRTLKEAREFLVYIASMRIADIRKQSHAIRKTSLKLLKHFPFEYKIDKLYEDK